MNAGRKYHLFPAFDGVQALRTETILATVRAAIVLCCLVATYFDRETTPFGASAYTFLTAYVCLTVGLLFWTRFQPFRLEMSRIVHGIEFLLVVLIGAFSQGSDDAFLIFASFVILAAAYRWGFTETVLTGGLLFIAFLTETFSSGLNSSKGVTDLVMGSICLPVITVLIAYLADQHNRAKAEDLFIGRILRVCQTEGALNPIVQNCLEGIADFYRAKGALLIVQENASHRVLEWRYPPVDGRAASRLTELDSETASKYLFWSPVSIWCWQNLSSTSNYRTFAVENDGRFIPRLQFQPPKSFLDEVPCGSILAGALVCGDDVAARLYILDPQWSAAGFKELVCLSRLADTVRPVVHNLYLWRKVRSRAHAIEQLRTARDLHDGIIQSLIALELEIEAVLLKNQQDASSRRQLERVQRMIREQSQEVRDLMYRMKVSGLTSDELIPFLENLVFKFRNETGIEAQFQSNIDEPALPAKVCHEVARIVQEALVNVRKHSRATRVQVELKNDGQDFVLSIEDNGEGSEFEDKRVTQDGSPKAWQPAVIRERVLLLRGSLSIKHMPGSGVRLVIRFPASEYSEWYASDSPFILSRPSRSSLSFQQGIKAVKNFGLQKGSEKSSRS